MSVLCKSLRRRDGGVQEKPERGAVGRVPVVSRGLVPKESKITFRQQRAALLSQRLHLSFIYQFVRSRTDQRPLGARNFDSPWQAPPPPPPIYRCPRCDGIGMPMPQFITIRTIELRCPYCQHSWNAIVTPPTKNDA